MPISVWLEEIVWLKPGKCPAQPDNSPARKRPTLCFENDVMTEAAAEPEKPPANFEAGGINYCRRRREISEIAR